MPVFARIIVAVCLFAAFIWVSGRVFVPSDKRPSYAVADKDVYLFPGVTGPQGVTVVAESNAQALARYSSGSPSRLAILLTDPDASWLGLAHGLKSIGVPFIITRDYQRALQHKVIFVYPSISGKVLSAEGLQAIARVPQHGGTLIGQNVLGGELYEVFGFADAVPSTKNATLHFQTDHPATRQLTETAERVVRIGIYDDKAHIKGTYAYINPKNPPWLSTKMGPLPSPRSPMPLARHMRSASTSATCS